MLEQVRTQHTDSVKLVLDIFLFTFGLGLGLVGFLLGYATELMVTFAGADPLPCTSTWHCLSACIHQQFHRSSVVTYNEGVASDQYQLKENFIFPQRWNLSIV